MSADGAARPTLVTGGAGYVGSVLVGELLAAGHRVRVLDSLAHGDGESLLHLWSREGFEFVRGDVRDPEARARALEGAGAVVHLAAIVGDPACARDPEVARAVNLDATHALVREAAAAGARRFVFASTCSNYGKMEEEGLATEDWPLRPVSLYAETKVAAELGVQAAAGNGLTTTCLRFATVFGLSPRMRFDLTVNEFARDALVNRELVVYGDQFWRPYVHVADAVDAIRSVLDAEADVVSGRVYNVGSERENHRKADLVALVTERLPETDVRRVEQLEDPRDYRVSFDRIERELGYAAKRTVGEGIDEVIEALASGVIADPFAGRYRN